MDHTMDEIKVTFHNRASVAMFSVYESYVRTLNTISRQGNENRYQQISSRYLDELRHRLQSIIKELMNAAKGKIDPGELNGVLGYLSSQYEREFMLKIKSL